MTEPELVAKAKQLQQQKLGIKAIAKQLKVGRTWLAYRLNPGEAERRKEWYRQYRTRLDGYSKTRGSQSSVHQDAMRLKALIPPDDRDLTGRLCGDPVGQRSALYQKMQGTQA